MQENRLFEALLDVIPFAAYAVDVNTYEVVYANKLCSEGMYAPREEYCWKKLYGQEEVCSWCKIAELKQREKIYKNDKVIHDYFDESSDKWYQSYDELVKWPDGRTVKYSIAVDISDQKEIQANMIKTNTKLAMQTKKLKVANQQLEHLAKKDYLTGTNNRGNFFNLGNELLKECIDEKEDLYVAMMDIDNFKSVNDTYGHSTGDIVLKRFVENIESYLDEKDIFGRLGGEEFALLIPGITQEDIVKKIEQIKQSTADMQIDIEDHKIQFTVSIGVEKLNSDDKVLDTILDRADRLLYSAKNDGKDKVRFRELRC